MYEQIMADFTYRDSELREFSSDHLAPSLIFFLLQWY